MMKILHISMIPIWVLKKKSGMPSITRMLEYYEKCGIEQEYIFFKPGIKKINTEYASKHIKVTSLPIPDYISMKSDRLPFAIRNKLQLIYLIFRYVPIIKKIIRKSNPMIIYSHLLQSAVPVYLANRNKRPLFLRLYGTVNIYKRFENKKHCFYRNSENLIPFTLNFTGYILVNDGTASNRLAKKLGIEEKRMLFIRNGVNDISLLSKDALSKFRSKLNISHNSIVGLFVSRLNAFKGVDDLIYFIEKIDLKHKNIVWIIVGDGVDKCKIEKYIKETKKKNIKLVGAINNHILYKYYQSADFFVSFNILSNLNNPVYDSITNGLPVFSLKRGYDCEVINEILFTENTVDELMRIFNNKYEAISNKSSKEYRNIINRMEQWEKKNFYSWDFRYNMELKFIKKRIKECGKE